MALKLFTGNMPELMEIILHNLEGDSNSLYTCALVNRHWCKISIPILWKDPFSFKQKPNYISKYLSYLDNEDKLCLNEFKISLIDDFPYHLFHYAKFLRVLDLSLLETKVRQWISVQIPTSLRYSANLTIASLLIKLFIESGVSLSRFHIMISKSFIKPEVFYSLGQNIRFFSQLQYVSVDTGYEDFFADENIAFLKVLAKTSTKIHTLQFNMHDVGYNVAPLCHALANIIRSQCQLTEFNLTGMDLNVQEIIFALATQQKSLKEFKIDYCYDSGINFNVLLKCEKLETLRIRWYDEKSEILKPLSNGSCNLNTLEIIDLEVDSSDVIQILKKNVVQSQSSLLEILLKFCPNITYLNISSIELSIQLIDLIGSLKNLQFLTLLWYSEKPAVIIRARIIQLIRATSPFLEYIEWRNINREDSSYVDILLYHCNAPLKKLICSNGKETIKAIIDFCKQKKTLKYVNIFYPDLKDVEKNLEKYVKLLQYDEIVENC
ncbi:hypothetical protein C2G38_2254034 [Gigaspora rosea]|uniref:F-box domain-containing protein n=1 Tax=Gigaspora rosea TaxID=44941 RepID=A0A397U7I6_9GLOM|nr:hypothetical protein C2G38_2254034 [Gigaspora rosea]